MEISIGGGKREMVDEIRMEELIQPFAHLTQAVKITLGNKSYSRSAAQRLHLFLVTLSSITIADCSDMIAGRPEEEALVVLESIANGLQGQELVELDLSDNALGEKGIRACTGLWRQQAFLERIYFCNNGISATATELIVEEVLLWRGEDIPTKLTVLHFYNNMSGDGGAVALAKVLPLCPQLTDLRFSATRAGKTGSRIFAQAMSSLHFLTRLDLCDTTLGSEGASTLAIALGQQKFLEELNLRDTSIGDEGAIVIAGAIASPLTNLDLSGNDITATGLTSWIPVFHSISTTLTSLMLEENELGSSGAKVVAGVLPSLLTLTKLGLYMNEIGSSGGLAVVRAITSVHVLECLQLNGNQFSQECIDVMSAHLTKIDKIHILDELDENDDDDVEEDEIDELEAITEQLRTTLAVTETFNFEFVDSVREVVDAARAVQLLEQVPILSSHVPRVSLRDKSYTADGAVVIAQRLSEIESAHHLDLSDMIAGRPEAEALTVLSCICTSLTQAARHMVELDMSDNALGEKGLRACEGVLQYASKVKKLYFCNNGLSGEAATLLVDILLTDTVTTPLETFEFYNNMSGDNGAVALSRLLPASPLLTHLRFSATRAGRRGSTAFAEGLASLKNMTHLDLSDNTFGQEGSSALLIGLKNMSQLKVLNLRDAALEDAGVQRVLDVIGSTCRQLTFLDLSSNELTVSSMSSVNEVMLKLPSLTHLALEENELEDEGLEALAVGLSNTSSLKTLLLNENMAGDEGAMKVAIALKSHTSLERLELNTNSFSQVGIDALQALLTTRLGSLEDNELA